MHTVCQSLLLLGIAFELPLRAGGASLRGLLSPPHLQPLQRPPPATADAAFAQMEQQVSAPAPAAGAPGPAPAPAATLPPKPKIPKLTEKTCATLTKKMGKMIG